MAAEKSKKSKAANVGASLYEGQLDINFDCIGTDKCAYARFYVEPPGPDDECAFSRCGGSCTHGPAQKAALEQLREKITEELKRMETEEE